MKTPRQKTLITIVMVIATAVAFPAYGEKTTIPIDLGKVQLGLQAQLANEGGQASIRVEGATGEKPQDIHLFDIDQPAITQDVYALTGEIRYENVAGQSYLETWNHFPSADGEGSTAAKFFTRTLNHTGPMSVISANSDWRPFQLPFFINVGDSKLAAKPAKITFNLHLEGAGLVEIRNVELVDGLETPAEALRRKVLPGPTEILLFVFLVIAAVAVVTTIIVVSVRRKNRIADELRRKKQTADELRRIRANDV